MNPDDRTLTKKQKRIKLQLSLQQTEKIQQVSNKHPLVIRPQSNKLAETERKQFQVFCSP